ncbi:hypothetical protein ACUIAK_21005 [Bacillus cytotoxicus]
MEKSREELGLWENYFMKTDIAVRVHPVVEHSGSLVPKGGQ